MIGGLAEAVTCEVVGLPGLEPGTHGLKGCRTPTTPLAALSFAAAQLAGPRCNCLGGRQFASQPVSRRRARRGRASQWRGAHGRYSLDHAPRGFACAGSEALPGRLHLREPALHLGMAFMSLDGDLQAFRNTPHVCGTVDRTGLPGHRRWRAEAGAAGSAPSCGARPLNVPLAACALMPMSERRISLDATPRT
jgi:hypothetical protein